jgi:hypothetical protein
MLVAQPSRNLTAVVNSGIAGKVNIDQAGLVKIYTYAAGDG